MIRLTRQTDYGIVLLTQLASDGAVSRTARELALGSRLPLPMVGKILKTLARAGLLASHRGVKGGYRLSRPPELISMAQVIDSLEGTFAMTECSQGGDGNCEHESFCTVKSNWRLINHAVRNALEGLTLADMARPLREQQLLTPVSLGRRVPAPAAAPILETT